MPRIFERLKMKILIALCILMLSSSLTKYNTKNYELSMVCDDHMKALEIRDYNTLRLKKTVLLPNCQNHYTYNVTAIPGSKVILYCFNSAGTAGGGGCIKDNWGTHCLIWKSWEGIGINFCNYEYRTIYGSWYYLYKLNQYSCCTTYGFYTTLPNKFVCMDSPVKVVAAYQEHDFSLEQYFSYEGYEKWGLYTVFTAGVEYVTYDEGKSVGTLVKTYVGHDVDQDYEFYTNIPGLYSIVWTGYGDWEYYYLTCAEKCYYNIRVCYQTCGDCDSTTQGDSVNHRCTKCRGSRFFKHGTKNCYSKDEIDDGYHYDDDSKEWVKCHKSCGRCSKFGNDTNPNCLTCSKEFPYLINGGKCVNNTDGYYYDNCTGKYLPCHSRCSRCSKGGNDAKHNCVVCAPGYHFVYTLFGQCIKDSEKPDDSYYNEKNDTYERCLDYCSKCTNKTVCNQCRPGYHRIFGKPGVCVPDAQIPDGYYYDQDDDYYKPCYNKCGSCKFPGNDNSHNCTRCAPGYHLIHGRPGICVQDKDKPDNYYMDNDTDTYRPCHSSCRRCYRGGDDYNTNCQICADGYFFVFWRVGLCVKPGNHNCTCALKNDTYVSCYSRCASCDKEGTSTNHNCKTCLPGYHKVYNKEGQCILPCERPDDTYYDQDKDSFEKCYHTCAACSGKGTAESHKCLDCAKVNGKYQYHFIFSKSGQCISENEKPDNTYLDNNTNTYRECYKSCGTCEKHGNSVTHNCKTCANGYHFIYSTPGNCILPSEKPDDTYYDEDDDTYKKCYSKCASCNGAGSDSNPNCKTCPRGYYFIYNQPGFCVKEEEKCDRCYLDEDDYTFKPCHERCGKCYKGGNSTNMNCAECLKFENGQFKFHFIFNNKGECVGEDQKCSNCYLDDSDNTYKECFSTCATCNKAGSSSAHNCNTCKSGYAFVNGKGSNCYPDTGFDDGYYKENDTWHKCYDTCSKCSKGGNSNNHNCAKCAPGYHFIYNQTGLCVADKPDDCYYDEEEDRFERCYSTCGGCRGKGDSNNHRCTICAKFVNGTFQYHFISTVEGQCVEKGNDNQYLDENDNTYKDCYETCGTCTKGGTPSMHNCKTCKNGYSFIADKGNNCFNNNENHDGYYKDEDDNTWKKCYDTCSKCNGKTNSSCLECAEGYHFIYNQPGVCVLDKPDDCYYDEEEDMYKKCYETCASCTRKGDANNHFCTECAHYDNKTFIYHFTHKKEGQCIKDKDTDEYLDETDNTFKKCYQSCATCSKAGTPLNNNCNTCAPGYKFVKGANDKNCISITNPDDGYYYEEGEDIIERCYHTCGKCNKGGNSENHNCLKCKEGYVALITTPTYILCVKVEEKPDDYYYDNETDSFKKCYATCNKCERGGNADNHFCTECKMNPDGTYAYHFTSVKEGQCVVNGNDNQYLDDSDNTYKDCYETCGTCSRAGNRESHNCNTCRPGFAFVNNKGNNCYSDNDNHDGYYKDEDDNTWKKCYDTCSKCSYFGNSTNHNCDKCRDGYHFIYNKTGYCVKPAEKCDNCYLDEDDDTYRPCYEKCGGCIQGGDSTNHHCTFCAKYSNGTFIYYFVYGHSGQCFNKSEINDDYYYDNDDNTYKPCYTKCGRCSKPGDDQNHNCAQCKNGYFFVYNKTGYCVSENERPEDTYYDNGTGRYERCYERCRSCNQGGNTNSHNCNRCIDGYFFIYNKTGYCVSPSEKPDDCYLENDTYRKCYERCGKCSKAGSSSDHNCLTCKKDSNGKYMYHFVEGRTGFCISESEKESNYYLDEDTNTYRKCYATCATCSRRGDSITHNCTTCINDYAFLVDKGNNCYEIKEKDGYYKDENGTWNKCYDTCTKCNKGGDSNNHNCLQCIDGYHFYLLNGKILCIKDKPDNSYLDNDTYKPCYERCSSCSQGGDSNNHNCLDCAKNSNGEYLYHFVHNKPGQCIRKDEADQDDYLDTGDNTYYDCYTSCKTCNKTGTAANHNCLTCKNGYHWIYAVNGNCLTEQEAKEKYPYTYYNETTDTFEKCYERCWTCFAYGNIKYHNCLTCREDYHLIYNQTGQCIRPCAKPEDTYLDTDTDTYRKCYDTCATCEFGGTASNNNCTECAKDSNGNYLYHFTYRQKGQCVPISQKRDDEYLDETDNTIKKCYDTCGSCAKGGNSENHNCVTCAPGFHWIYNKDGNCVNNQTCGDDTYYDEEDDTYKKCHYRCRKCRGYGDDENNNCAACPVGYHFIYNHYGQCIPEIEKCRRCYIDEEDDTYKECYERCETCVKGGNSNSHFCTECKKENGQYLYHFIYGRPGICLTDNEKPDDHYFDSDDNTFKPCYARCSRCNKTGTFTQQNCMACKPGYNLDESKNQCLNEEESNQDGKYVEDGKIKDCYSTCRKCSKGGSQNDHNCDECIDGYHFYWKTPKMCIKDQPDHTYFDNTTNTYRECYDSCKTCIIGGDNGKHNCLTCANGYHFIYLYRGNCIPESQKPNNTYYNEEDDTYEKCYDKCSRCNYGGNNTVHNCSKCNDNLHFMWSGGTNCFLEHEKCENCYYDETTDRYEKCYDSCKTCFKGGNSSNHNCRTCPPGYHFIWDKPGWCIKEGTQPNNTYFNDDDNTYYPCYSRCNTCFGKGSASNHNCRQCFVFENGTYKYHFTIDKEHQCISKEEAEHDYYLDNNTNTYEQCHKNCYYCSKAGTDAQNNCDRCNPYYHFIYNKTGQCIPESQKPEDTYYNPETDTFEKCYDTCRRCSGKGTASNPKCTKCADGYHFIYNQTGVCIREGTQPEDTYLDTNCDTYRKCHFRCGKCQKYGSDQCLKCANGYHFVFYKSGYCVTEEEKCINCYLDNKTDTYEKCYDTCYTCSKGGNSDAHNCNTCPQGYYKIFGSNNCYRVSEIPSNYYYEEECGCFKKCHNNCAYCSGPGTDTSNNCKKCVNGFYFIYNNAGHCIREGTQPEHTYLDRDTYRLCYERCDTCYGYGYAGYHNCKTCAKDSNGKYIYHFTWNIYPYICISESERPERSYLDETDNTYKKCHNYCLECNQGGTDAANRCTKCIPTRHFIYNQVEQGNCIKPSQAPNNTYLKEENDTFVPCHSNCFYCSKAGTDENNNCDLCKNGYHFIWNKPGHCIREGTQPNNTYLDNYTDTYRKCYETCSSCFYSGDAKWNYCLDCAKDSNGKYTHHFTYTQQYQCILPEEQPERTYLDETDNTFKRCQNYCLECSRAGTENANYCTKCINTRHFVYNQVDRGNCIKPSQAPNDTYLNTDNDTYVPCHKSCFYCSKAGDDNNNNCDLCKDGYHFIYNHKGQCIKEGDQPENTYLDGYTDTYRKCYDTCRTCFYGGNSTWNYCLDCAKDAAGNYKYHFTWRKDYQCIPESERPERSYLDESDNTYKKCHNYCLECNQAGTDSANHCTKCINTRHFIYNQVDKGNCIRPSQAPNDTFLNEENDTFVRCHSNCYYCSKAGDDNNNNCDLCKDGYHFIWNKPGQCIREGTQPEDTYLDGYTDTYRKCYETCRTCFYQGSSSWNYCLDCAKDSNGVYKYHFTWRKDYQCIPESERPERSYLDESDNTYKKCHNYCLECNQAGTDAANRCTKCIPTRHFIYNEVDKGNCIRPSQAPNNTFLNEENDTFVPCHKNCYYCSKSGDDENNNCDLCKDGYHFIYNHKGQCIREGTQPNNTYLDRCNDMYKKCYDTCATCVTMGTADYNNCKKCAVDSSGNYLYHFIYNRPEQCIPESERPSNTYYERETNTYKKCYSYCATCSKGPTQETPNCDTCINGYHLIEGWDGMCVRESEKPENYYFDEVENKYKKCYDTCYKCTKGGDATNHNCARCASGYYFIYDQPGICIRAGTQPNNTYLDYDTYRLCYETCGTCSRGGTPSYHNCNTCLKNSDGTFKYHFIYTIQGQCVSESEKCTNCYLDNSTNRYRPCHSLCATCDRAPDDETPHCTSCPPGYSFIYNYPGLCVRRTEKCYNCYIDEDDNTIKKCNETCATCSRGPDSTSPHCTRCPQGYHFIYNVPGLCVAEKDKCSNCYLDCDDTYKKCYDTCSRCAIGGNENNHNCLECAKDSTGKYTHHFVYNKPGQCIPESERPNGTHLDEGNNTYVRCYETCSKCNQFGDSRNHKCTKCAPGYHFTYESEGNCVNVVPNNSYYNEEEDKYEKCYDKCSRCNGKGNSTYHNCAKCAPGYHFIVNQTGMCVKDKPSDYYYDEEDDMYKKCYNTCGTCDKAGSENNNNCKTCLVYVNGTFAYHFIYTHEGQCVSEQEKCSNCYLDNDDNTYKPCYDSCSSCKGKGSVTNHNCYRCAPGYHFVFGFPGLCIREEECPIKCPKCYIDDNDTYRECYERCESCTKEGNSTNHNCKMCKQNSDGSFAYYFILGQEGQCISPSEKPENYYLDDDNTFKPCYERCASCSRKGDAFANNCNECAKGSSGYLYHFIYNQYGQCISEDEKPDDTYLDTSDNTYKKCYDTCGTCTEFGDRNDHKCITCAPGYHFIYDQPNKCVPEESKCNRCYLDEEDNTYKKCYEACSSCSKGGSFNNHNCDACAKAPNGSFILHFIYNETGNCYDECDMPDGLYLDRSDNTFKKCFYKCQNCKELGDETSNKCTECAKNDAGEYLYALVYNQPGQCVAFGNSPAGATYNNRTNVYEKCHKRCGSCYGEGTDEENMCTLCAYTVDSNTGEYTYTAHFSYVDREKGNCYYPSEKPPQTYLNNETNTYEECYPRCLTCERGGDDEHNNCTSCILDDENNTYLWWIVDNPGQCLTSGEAPNNTYLNTENNTYLYCYERCGSCTELGNETDHKCTSCAKDIITGDFLYHSTEANPTNCITADLQPSNTYLDKEDNTYKACYERCESCSAAGTADNMNCDVCKTGSTKLYTITDKPGQCVTKDDAPANTFFDESRQVFVSCYETCGTCTSTGNSAQNNCTTCLRDETFEYYPLEGKTGQCVNLTIVGDNHYLDNGVYKKCFGTCGSCSKAGDATNNNCDDCLKDENGKYLYHFVQNQPGQCISESEKPNDLFLNESDNTYTSCPSGWTYTDGACYQLLSLDELVNKLGNSDFVLNLKNKTYENPNENFTFLVTTNTSDIDNYVNKIKELYNLSESTNLLVGVVNTLNEDGTANKIISRVFTEDGSELDIVEFNDDTLTVNLPFNGTETLTPELAKYIHDYDNEYDVFDPKNKFYNDYCASFQDKNGHDVTLEDRQKYYYNNYCGNCKYVSMNYETNKISCKCSVSGKNLNEHVVFSSSNSINLAVLKCTNESFKGKHLKNNASFFLITGCILGQIGLIISFFMFGYPQLLNRVKNVANPVKNATENKEKNKITFKVDDLKNPGSELEQNDKLSHKTSDSNIISNSQVNFANSISNINKMNEKPENDSPISIYKFAYMVQNTEKTYLAMYWEIFKEEYTLLRCMYRKSIFETYAFNFTFYIMYLTFVLGFNALFLYGKVMHLIYLEQLSSFQYILSPILACIATQIVLYFPKLYLFDYPMFYSVYKNQKKVGEIHDTIKALVEKVKSKTIIFFVFIVGFTLFNLIYLTCFCSIFNGSQGKLYADFLISLIIFLMVNAMISAIIAGLRYYGFHNNNERILKIQKTLKDFFISF